MKIIIGSDHRGYKLKKHIISVFKCFDFIDIGCHDKKNCDYCDISNILCQQISENYANKGILICGTGIGMSISSNRYKHIRCALCHDEKSTMLARKHNNANVLALGSDIIDKIKAEHIIKIFFDNYEKKIELKHETRISKISNSLMYPQVLFSKNIIEKRIDELKHQIQKDYKDYTLVIIGVLKGGYIFMSDISKNLCVKNCHIDFMDVKSYNNKNLSNIVLNKDISVNIKNKHVLIIKDIIDTGKTIKWIKNTFI